MIDLARPPVRPGPRLEGWAIFAIAWAVGFGLYVLAAAILSNPFLGLGVVLPVAIIGLLAASTMSYAMWRLQVGTDIAADVMMATGERIGDPERARRVSDPEERRAWKRLKRGAITRVEYEQLMARRRFVHGELSGEEYHELMRELDSAYGKTEEKTYVLPSHHEPP